jgi:uncharacterized FlgJ-related protein
MKKKSLLFLTVLLVAAGCAAFLFLRGDEKALIVRKEDGIYVTAKTTRGLQKAFLELNYDIAGSLNGKNPVPRIFTTDIPKDFNREKFDQIRPALFTEILLPLILKANAEAEAERLTVARLIDDLPREQSLTELKRYAEKYRVSFKPERPDEMTRILIERTGTVPPGILLAMAAQDSGLATDGYAHEYNNLFRHRNWDGKGAKPEEPLRPGETYRISVYPTLYDGIVDQILHINTTNHLGAFHAARRSYGNGPRFMGSRAIVGRFISIPDRSLLYTDILDQLLRQYEWNIFDRAVLSPK